MSGRPFSCQKSGERKSTKIFRTLIAPGGVHTRAGHFCVEKSCFPEKKLPHYSFRTWEIRRISAETVRDGRRRRICKILRFRQRRSYHGEGDALPSASLSKTSKTKARGLISRSGPRETVKKPLLSGTYVSKAAIPTAEGAISSQETEVFHQTVLLERTVLPLFEYTKLPLSGQPFSYSITLLGLLRQ